MALKPWLAPYRGTTLNETSQQSLVRIRNAAGDGGRVITTGDTLRCTFAGVTMVTSCTDFAPRLYSGRVTSGTVVTSTLSR